jgi:hypothetical protein
VIEKFALAGILAIGCVLALGGWHWQEPQEA